MGCLGLKKSVHQGANSTIRFETWLRASPVFKCSNSGYGWSERFAEFKLTDNSHVAAAGSPRSASSRHGEHCQEDGGFSG